MHTEKIKKVFPGGNTANGFHSFYDYIIEKDATRILILKGGPGVGKSSFMKYISKKMIEKGYDVEHHCCSSDPNSLDGLKIPALNVALIDGTTPHIVDPKNPGVVDEIINLGEFWDEKEIIKHKNEVLKTNEEIGQNFKRAYFYLEQCRAIQKEIYSYYINSKSINISSINKVAFDIIKEIFKTPSGKYFSKERHLFGSAITPEGAINHLSTIFNETKNYILNSSQHLPDLSIVKKIYEMALIMGYDLEIYHCSLCPEKIEHLYFPELKTGIITNHLPHEFKPQKNNIVIDIAQYINSSSLAQYNNEIKYARNRFNETLNKAISFIKLAKYKHDILEKYYIDSMNYTPLNKLKDKILQRILNY